MAAQDDRLGVEQVHGQRDARAEGTADPLERPDDAGLAGAGAGDDVLDLGLDLGAGDLLGLGELGQDGADAREVLDAAGAAVDLDEEVADLPGEARGTAPQRAVDDEPAPESDLAGQVEHVADPGIGAEALLGDGAEVGVVVDRDGVLRVAHGRVEADGEVEVGPAEHGGALDDAVVVDHAGHGDGEAEDLAALGVHLVHGALGEAGQGRDRLARGGAGAVVGAPPAEEPVAAQIDRDERHVIHIDFNAEGGVIAGVHTQ